MKWKLAMNDRNTNGLKVLHFPENVGGHPGGLAVAERQIGLDSKVLTLYRTRFSYPGERCYDLGGRSVVKRIAGHFQAFWENRKGYDAYHFNFGSSPMHFPSYGMNLLDIPFYDRSARKVMTYQGCDARQKYPTIERNNAQGYDNYACFENDCYSGICNSGKRDSQRRKAIDKVARYVDHIFAVNPDLLYFLPRELASFMPYAVSNLDKISPTRKLFFENEQIHIVHAPTERVAKGTPYILKAFQMLEERYGARVKFTLVENMTHDQALSIYASADLVVDQALIGWYGGLAVEVMKMGIPVATFINDAHLDFVPSRMVRDFPFIRIDKYTIYDRLVRFIEQRDQIYELAGNSISFVKRWHDAERLARVSSAAYLGETLPEI